MISNRKNLIHQHCLLTNVLGINVYLITPDCKLYFATDEKSLPFPDPWWAFAWPGGVSVARYILDNPNIVKNKRILDIGSGCGIASLAAAKVGAREVIANDIDQFAGEALMLNIKSNPDINKDFIKYESHDLITTHHDFMQYDVVLCGDMLYDKEFSNKLLHKLSGHQMVIFGDPGRICCPKEISTEHLLATYPLEDGDGFSDCRVFRHV